MVVPLCQHLLSLLPPHEQQAQDTTSLAQSRKVPKDICFTEILGNIAGWSGCLGDMDHLFPHMLDTHGPYFSSWELNVYSLDCIPYEEAICM